MQIIHAQATMDAMESESGELPISGVACDYDKVGSFGPKLKVAIAPGAASKTLKAKMDSAKRDILGLVSHDSTRVIARTGNGTLKFEENADHLAYQMHLNPEDPDAVSVFAKVKRGDYNAASIGFGILEGENTKMVDNSLEASSDEPVRVVYAKEIELAELSVLAQGAFSGATAEASNTILAQFAEPEPEPEPEPEIEMSDKTFGHLAGNLIKQGIFTEKELNYA